MFFVLKERNIHGIYKNAAQIVSSKGFSQTLIYDPYSKSVDLIGAILLACGASEKLMHEGETEAELLGIPEGRIIDLMLAIEFLEASVDGDIAEWCSNHLMGDAVSLLKRLSDRIEMSVVRQKG